MRKCLLWVLLAALLLWLCACGKTGKPQDYDKEHEHVPTFSYEASEQNGDKTVKVRYCKICHVELPSE